MARKKGSFSHGDQGASNTMRRLGAVLTFVAVSIIVVAAGYYVGQIVISRVFSDSLGPTPGTPVVSQTSPLPQSTASSDTEPHNVAAEPHAAVRTPLGTTPMDQGTAVQSRQEATPPAGGAGASAGESPVSPPASSIGKQTEPSSSGGVSTGTQTTPPATTTPATPPAAASTPPAAAGQTGKQLWHRVQVGNFTSRSDAEALLATLRADYPDAYIVVSDVFRVQIGSFNSKAGADEAVATLRGAGYADVHLITVEL